MSEKEKENLLLKIYNELIEFKSDYYVAIKGISNKQQSMSNEQVGMKQEIQKVKQEQIIMNTNLNTIKKDLQTLTNTVTRMEFEHSNKLNILFDAFTTNNQNIQIQNNKISILEKKVKNHDHEIYYLKSKKEA